MSKYLQSRERKGGGGYEEGESEKGEKRKRRID